MGTVTSELTRISDVEGSLTLTSIGGGAGASANADNVLQGAQSVARRQTNTTNTGFWLAATSRDVSATGVHVGVWVSHNNYSVLTKLQPRIGSSTANWHGHTFPLSTYPLTGGWVRIWMDVGRTPEDSAGTFNKAALTQIGLVNSLPSVSGNAVNLFMDASDFTTGGLLLTGTAGVFDDFLAADERNSTNVYGVVTSKDGVIYCLARLTLASATSLVFSDSGFVVVFPNQALVSETFMGLSIDLQNASTDITMNNGVIRSAGTTRRGDFVITGTSGEFTGSSITYVNMRIITLTSSCSLTNSSFSECGTITPAGAVVTGSTISGSFATTAMLWNSAVDTDTRLDGSSFTSAGTGHAIELGASTPTTITLRGINFSGYAGSDGTTGNESLYNNSGKTITVNVIGGTSPSIRNGSGADTILVADPRTVGITARDAEGTPIQNARAFLRATSGGPFPYQASVTISNSGTTATVTHTSHGLATGDKVLITGASHLANRGIHEITVTGVNTYTYTMSSAPGSDPTGTITATFVFLSGLTDSSGYTSMSRVIPSNQPVIGWARKSTEAPFYKTGPISGVVSSSGDSQFGSVLVLDE